MDVVVRSVVRCHRLVSGRAAGGDHRLLVIRNRHRERSTRGRLRTGVGGHDGHRGRADRILAVGVRRGGTRGRGGTVGDLQVGIVVGRAEGRHRQGNGGVVLARIRVPGDTAQTVRDGQRVGLAHRHGFAFNRTAVGIGHRHIVLASSQVGGRG